jgi:hypothetical protein
VHVQVLKGTQRKYLCYGKGTLSLQGYGDAVIHTCEDFCSLWLNTSYCNVNTPKGYVSKYKSIFLLYTNSRRLGTQQKTS